jgi:hypothetical protein
MSTHALRSWTDLVKLHPDVEAGTLTEAVFAIDLGAIAANDPNVPVVTGIRKPSFGRPTSRPICESFWMKCWHPFPASPVTTGC